VTPAAFARNQDAPSSFIPVIATVEPARGDANAGTDSARGIPREPRDGLRKIIRTFDPDVPGCVFWPIIFGVGAIFGLVVLLGF
jgi:hypothetical protein